MTNNNKISEFDKLPDEVLKDLNRKEVTETELLNTGKGLETPLFSDNNRNSDTAKEPNVNFGTAKDAKPIQVGKLIGGEFATNLLDTLFPALLVLIAGYVGYKLEKKKLQLTDKEKELIYPAMQEYLDSINLNFNNPLYNLLFIVGGVYAAKFIDILPELEKKPKNKEEKKVAIVKNIEEKIIQKEEKKKTKEETDNDFLSMPYEIALEAIEGKRKKGKQDAINYYNKIKLKAVTSVKQGSNFSLD